MIGACSRILGHEAVAKPRFSVQAIFLIWIIQGSVLLGLVLVFFFFSLYRHTLRRILVRGFHSWLHLGLEVKGIYEISFFGRIS